MGKRKEEKDEASLISRFFLPPQIIGRENFGRETGRTEDQTLTQASFPENEQIKKPFSLLFDRLGTKHFFPLSPPTHFVSLLCPEGGREEDTRENA